MGKVIRPLGARILVKEHITSLSLTERGKRAGITVITDSRNQPKPTTGRIVAVGNDPIFTDMGWDEAAIAKGIDVSFGANAGTYVYVEDRQFRSIEFQEVITYTVEEEDEKNPDVVCIGSTNDSSSNAENLTEGFTEAGGTISPTNVDGDHRV